MYVVCVHLKRSDQVEPVAVKVLFHLCVYRPSGPSLVASLRLG